jgi:hypothetical protein
MTMFLTVIVSLYVFSHAYNLLLFLWYDNPLYQINSHMGATNARYEFEDLQNVRCVKISMYHIRYIRDIAHSVSYTTGLDYSTRGN